MAARELGRTPDGSSILTRLRTPPQPRSKSCSVSAVPARNLSTGLVGLGLNVVAGHDELEKVAPAHGPVEVRSPSAVQTVIYDRGATRRLQVADDKAVVGVKGEGKVEEADAWELDETQLSIAAPSSPQAIGSLGDVVESHLDTGVISQIIVLLLILAFLTLVFLVLVFLVLVYLVLVFLVHRGLSFSPRE
ncbi:MAG: hypothetical protein Q9184_000252 [Pyrenodesmia sp. 2 TL-2023]